ncbi:RDD family protein [Thermomonas haemolytica]|uniref:RDD family protein n=1 Tax=Thermomonas haemolytica TaxID=141949 RepID=A0A4R3NDQ6_9GAMM|nr:RDD family protein [Thermomonas haemolytica]
MVRPPDPVAAGFWRRYAAWSLDAACLLPLVMLLGAGPLRRAWAQADAGLQALMTLVAGRLDAGLAQGDPPLALALAAAGDPRLQAAAGALTAALGTLLGLPLLLYALLAMAWALGFEASPWQATPGQRALGLRVTDAAGARAGAGRVLLRHLAAGLSWASLNLGHALAAFPPHLALHDRLSGTRVLARDGDPRLPAWARAWLWLQATACVFALAWLYRLLQAQVDAALRAALGS